MPIPQSAKQMAINAAKQAARESNEVVKTAVSQVTGIEKNTQPEPARSRDGNEAGRQPLKRENAQTQPPRKNLNFLNIYKGELEQIRKENLFKTLQQKIASGEEVPIGDYANELSSEQREVLKAQETAVAERNRAAVVQQKQRDSVPQIIAKKARGMVGSFKKRNQQHVETQKMPSN